MTVRLIKLAGSLVVCLFDLLTGFIRRGLGMKKIGTCVVLYYHVVTQKQRAMFARQMDWLEKHRKPVSINKLMELEAGVWYVAVTFDDGFQSVIENALPELDARDIPVTVFVPSGLLGHRPCWAGSQEFVLDARQLRELNRHPLVSIGSHCISHPNLLHLNEHQAENEILGTKLQLEKILGEEIQALSFPFGAFAEPHVAMAREAAYSLVFTTLPELITEYNSRKFVVGRVRTDPTDWPMEFRLKALGAYRWLPWAFRIKRNMRSLFGNRSDNNNEN